MPKPPKKALTPPVCSQCGVDISGNRVKTKDILNNSYTPKMYECPKCGVGHVVFDGRLSLSALSKWANLNNYRVSINSEPPADPVIPPLPSPQANLN